MGSGQLNLSKASSPGAQGGAACCSPRSPVRRGLVASLGSAKDASLPHLPTAVCPSSLSPSAPIQSSLRPQTGILTSPWVSSGRSSCHLVTLSVNACPPARPCPSAPAPPALILVFLRPIPDPPPPPLNWDRGELSPSLRINRNFLGPKVLEPHPFPTSPGEGATS